MQGFQQREEPLLFGVVSVALYPKTKVLSTPQTNETKIRAGHEDYWWFRVDGSLGGGQHQPIKPLMGLPVFGELDRGNSMNAMLDTGLSVATSSVCIHILSLCCVNFWLLPGKHLDKLLILLLSCMLLAVTRSWRCLPLCLWISRMIHQMSRTYRGLFRSEGCRETVC